MAEYILDGIKYVEPKTPKSSDIRGFGKPKRYQIWERHTEYEQWDWNTDPEEGVVWFEDPEEGQLEWYQQEIERINHGEWIFIQGKPVYINKFCYMYHQWYIHQGGYYSQFRDTSLDFFRIWESIDNDPSCLGLVGVKGRRLGMSSMAANIHLVYALTEKNNLQGIVSKQAVDAKEMYLMFKNALENLPEFLMPSIRNIGEKETHLATPRERASKNNQKVSKDRGLNNRVNWLAPSENAYDGRELRFLVLDEAGKYEECSIQKLFSKVQETLATGATVVGKVLMFSTVNEPSKGGEEFEKIWIDSDHQDTKRFTDGKTASKMKRYFVPSYVGVQGYIGVAGESIVDTPTPEQTEYLKNAKHPKTGRPLCDNPYIGSKEFRENEIKLKGTTPELLAEEKRKFPFTWQEAFQSAKKIIYFNRDSHEAQLSIIEEKLRDLGRDAKKGELGRRGWFRENIDGTVRFEDDEAGLWYIHEFPETPNLFEKSTIAGKDVYKPRNTSYGGAGLDPIAHSDLAVDGSGSDAAVVIRKRVDVLDPDNSGKPVALFIGRMDRKADFHKQVYYGIKYYGVMMLGERAPSDFIDFAKENGYTDYLVGVKRSDGSFVYGVPPQNKETIEQHLSAMVESSYNDVEKIWYRRLIQDRLNFDVQNRGAYDGALADGYALLAIPKTVVQEKRKTAVKLLSYGKITTY